MKMTKNKLWQTGGEGLHPLVEDFTVGDDYIVDNQLLPYDIKASMAHAGMLFKMGIFDAKELSEVKQGLDKILSLWEKGRFAIRKDQEDSHTAIEQFLTENYGDVGKKIHTGRSRNDQSLVMIRLFMKEKLAAIREAVNLLMAAFREKTEAWNASPMPGYTHMQKAMPATAGMWLDAFSAAFADFGYALQAVMT
ncbi:MAG: argininosuccinate lyase, partial [Sinomicrobium sp.]|nr:argininosuccinate lyase [Sinomicrobium sp.]